jgi:hypothetical protein
MFCAELHPTDGGIMSISFALDPTVAGVWRLDVVDQARITGHIKRRTETGTYLYFRGLENNSEPSYEERDLDALKKLVTYRP